VPEKIKKEDTLSKLTEGKQLSIGIFK